MSPAGLGVALRTGGTGGVAGALGTGGGDAGPGELSAMTGARSGRGRRATEAGGGARRAGAGLGACADTGGDADGMVMGARRTCNRVVAFGDSSPGDTNTSGFIQGHNATA